MELTEAVKQLYQLVYERDQALSSYSQYQRNIDSRAILEVDDAGIFATIGAAYKTHQDLIAKVKVESETLFKSLPPGLHFALGVLGKPLFLGVVYERMQPTKEWYGLVARPFRTVEDSDGIVTVEKYACDVVKVAAPY